MKTDFVELHFAISNEPFTINIYRITMFTTSAKDNKHSVITLDAKYNSGISEIEIKEGYEIIKKLMLGRQVN